MSNRTKARAVHRRRGLRRLLAYISSIAAGVICGVLLSSGWSRQPIIPARYAAVPPAPAGIPLAPPQAPATNTASKNGGTPVDAQPPVETPPPLLSPPQISSKDEEAPDEEIVKPPPPSESVYLVQVAAFSQKANAARSVFQYKAAGYAAGMVKIGKAGSPVLYRVYIDRFKDQNRAKAAAKAYRVKEKKYAYAVHYQPADAAAQPGQR